MGSNQPAGAGYIYRQHGQIRPVYRQRGETVIKENYGTLHASSPLGIRRYHFDRHCTSRR